MAKGDFFGIGVSGLLAFQRSLNTISHNIANVNTPGYTRQRVDLVTRPPQRAGDGFIGTGVQVASVQRVYNGFLVEQVRVQTALASETETYLQYATQVDNLLADPDAGLSPVLQEFFAAVQGVADDPASIPARQVLLAQGEALTNRFNYVYDRLDSLFDGLQTELVNTVDEINALARSIAGLNDQIIEQEGLAGGQPANDLRDQRDELIRRLSEKVAVTVVPQDDGALNVFIGNGQNLVVGSTASVLGTTGNVYDPSSLEITLTAGSGSGVVITDAMRGGSLGGLVAFRREILEPALNGLGRVAAGLAFEFNARHRLGMDLDDRLGGDFFTPAQVDVAASSINGGTGSVTGTLVDPAGLTTSDYTLRYDGANAYTLTRLSDGATFAINTGGNSPYTTTAVDGFTLTITAGANVGDTFLVRPVRYAARTIAMAVDDPREVAAAAPVRTAVNLANTGSGRISAGEVVDTTNAAFTTTPGALTPPILIRFDSATTYSVYDNTNPASPVLLENNIPYNPATGGEVFPTPGALDYGYRVRIDGAPRTGDEFTIDYNTGGVSDNRNALELAELQTRGTLAGGGADFQSAYGQMVADVGSRTGQARIRGEAQQTLLNQAIEAREGVSGVNLDEEAANLLRFQQAYQAAAQVLSTANSLFQSLLDAVRG